MFKESDDANPFKYIGYWVLVTLCFIILSRAADKAITSQAAQNIVQTMVSASLPMPEIEPTTSVLPDVPLSTELINAVVAACGRYSVPIELALAVMEVESAYQTDAVNGACVGLYQINTEYLTAYKDAIGITDILEPVQNIESGVWYLGQLLGKHEEVDLALMHYNLGNKADRLWREGVRNTKYTDKVNAAWERLLDK
ncbi:MAG: transglycosylase SLT domain-containing protein [Oscillospiraceae bacterium]